MDIAFTVVITVLKNDFPALMCVFTYIFLYLRIEKGISDETVGIHTIDNAVLCRICQRREQKGLPSRAGQPACKKFHSEPDRIGYCHPCRHSAGEPF